MLLEWRAPAEAARAWFYRVERTWEGRRYQTLAETQKESYLVRKPSLRKPWFYRVTAVNERGAGRARLVWFLYHRRLGQTMRVPIPVIPGLRVNIYELGDDACSGPQPSPGTDGAAPRFIRPRHHLRPSLPHPGPTKEQAIADSSRDLCVKEEPPRYRTR